MSLLTYNTIALPYSMLTKFECRNIYDEMGKIDRACTQFDIGVQALITAEAMDMLAPTLAGRTTNPADIMKYAYDLLMTPRKQLSFKFNGVEFIPGKAGVTGTVDAMNGPLPQSCSFTRMNNTTWLVQYHIIAHYWIRYSISAAGAVTFTNLPGGVALYNRWEERVELDHLEYSTRQRRGKFMIRSDNRNGILADEYRSQLAVCGVPEGFLRLHSSYTVDPAGLGLGYHLVDKEVYRLPPPGAFRAQGDYGEQGTRGDGKRYITANLRLEAGKTMPQWELARLACAVVAGKLDIQGAKFFVKTNRAILEGASIRVGMYDNWAEVMMRAMVPVDPKVVQGAAFIKPEIGKVHASDGVSPAPSYLDRGSANLLLNAAAYFDPDLTSQLNKSANERASSNLNTPNGGRNQMDTGLRPGEAGKTPE